uniref:Peroxisomal nicotinamide adenine dinucleotide carrier n=1 Tax=Brassica campestris TaxID=3711 RepID=M4DKL1_BRACM
MSDALINGLAGAGGGIIAQLLTYPLQTVNTRQQTERDIKREKRKLGTIEHMCQGVYYYFYQVFRNQAEAAALQQSKIGFGDGSVGMFSSLLVAALAGAVNVLMTNPIWVIVTRMQTHRKMPKDQKTVSESPPSEIEALVPVEPRPYGTFNTIRDVYDESGVTGFWKGVIPTLIMVSNPSMQFMLYETMLAKLKKKRALNASNNVTAWETFLLGAVAKLGATVTTYPLLVVKSRLQAKQVTTGDKRHQYKGTLDAILKMIRYEGLYGFYKGMSTKIVQSVLAAAVLFMIKEELVKGAKLLLSNGTSSKVKSKLS